VFYFNIEPRMKWNKNVLAAKTFLFHFIHGSMLKEYTKTILKSLKDFYAVKLFFHFMMEPREEIKIGWATDGDGSGMKFFLKYFNVEPLFYTVHWRYLDQIRGSRSSVKVQGYKLKQQQYTIFGE